MTAFSRHKDEDDLEGAHFLPHHGALREDRETTKMRIVFDGPARADKNHYSLNDLSLIHI